MPVPINFSERYHKSKFLDFLESHFLPEDFAAEKTKLDIGFKPLAIKMVSKLGQVASLGNLEVYEVVHTSENDPRVSLSRDIFRLMAQYGTRRALVIFTSPRARNYRFSLVTLEFKMRGRRTTKHYSNPRRYSFFLGEEAKIHTPSQSLIKNGRLSDFDDLVSRFDVEVVTKEFFDQYKCLFDRLCKYLNRDPAFKMFADRKKINIDDFAKKLLGQIVFIYFLQRKGLLGASKDEPIDQGDKNFLRTIFSRCQKEGGDFFNDYLEYLFYDALNKKPDKTTSFYRDKFRGQIPFLNGGLFEPLLDYEWDKEMLIIPNEIFSDKARTGILDVFDLYNFTVAEDDATDVEVSVDPEMLGKVFESLLAKEQRKGKGTYYTPRQIVHYMCRESLINYLATAREISEKKIREFITGDNCPTEEAIEKLDGIDEYEKAAGDIYLFDKNEAKQLDELLQNIKVCDPACGSGAFLVGMLHEIINARQYLDTWYFGGRGDNYQLKKQAIENNIYGVDIDHSAVDISKLRLWLSLVVDYRAGDIEPLPNLDYKIRQGNSLIEDIIIGDTPIKISLPSARSKRMKNLFEKEDQHDLFGERDQQQEKVGKLVDSYHEYFGENEIEKKTKLKKEIDGLEKNIIEEAMNNERSKIESRRRNRVNKLSVIKGMNKADARGCVDDSEKEANINEFFKKYSAGDRDFFLWQLYFADVFRGDNPGFDVVIANPPYVKEYVNKSAFDGLRSLPCYQGKMDLWYLFACKGLDIARSEVGIVTFIAQSNWVTSYGASKMRNKIITEAQILSLLDFGDFKIFEAGIQTMVMLFRKNADSDSYTFDYRRLHGNNLEINDVIGLLRKEGNSKSEYLNLQITRSQFIDKTLTFSSSYIQQVLEKIASKANFHLNPRNEVAQGIVCPQDYVNKASQKVLGVRFRIGDGIFTLSDNELRALRLSKKESDLVKSFYTTDELQRWRSSSRNQRWIIYTDSSFKSARKIEAYPNIKRHLDQFRKVITSDNKPYGLHRARDEYFFKGEKIISVRKCVRPTFTYVDFDSYVSATFYVIKTGRVDQKYLTGLLNSSLIAFWLRHKGKMQGTNFQIDKEPLLALPLLNPEPARQTKIVELVNKILAITKDDDYLENPAKQAKVREYEKQIDQLVYKLYGLTDKEIELIKRSSRPRADL